MSKSARRIVVTGRVQGVGYRPFVYVTANELGLTGSVLNGSGKVFIHAEGESSAIQSLESALIHSAPPLARPNLAESSQVEPIGTTVFEILASSQTGETEIHVPPDLYTCEDCVKELTTRGERRYGYPFINCTQCGPRYTIITAMPYDRPNTSMAAFPLCDDCRSEYESPVDRRFHAQPLACAKCGPQLEFIMGREQPVGARFARDRVMRTGSANRAQSTLPQGKSPVGEKPVGEKPVGASLARDRVMSTGSANRAQSALLQAVLALRDGLIVAVKGVGGYHLLCDAANDEAVSQLRQRKHRPHKPLAVMFPISGEDGLDSVRESLLLTKVSAHSILDPARPIVLAKKRPDFRLSKHLAPGLRELGVFLPYSPLHHQLLREFDAPLVATSGNISGEPVITGPEEAESRLSRVADAFLHHNRPIVRPADDPVMRPIAGKSRVIRLGRGIAPVERVLPQKLDVPVLAVGGHLKVTVALAWEDRVVVSPHIGELDSPRSMEVFTQVIDDVQNIYGVSAEKIICDAHPGYASTQWADRQDLPLNKVQHHAAHASSLAGEHPGISKWLVFAWDGVGYGTDGTLWGGEALVGEPGQWKRMSSFRSFKLVGGDKAGRQPWRSAAAMLWAVGGPVGDLVGGRLAGDYLFDKDREQGSLLQDSDALELAYRAWQKDINTHQTSAVGRLFDAAAALVMGRRVSSFEGQGPMELEQIASQCHDSIEFPLAPDEEGILRSDWAPILPLLRDDSVTQADRAAIFHASMAQALVDQAIKIREQYRFEAVGLSGGVFQNRLLTELVLGKLDQLGFDVRLHEEIPANDGGLSFGQVIETMHLSDVGA